MIPHSSLDEIARKFVILPAVAPAAVVATGWWGPAGFEFAQGAAFKAERGGSDANALFDLASISKSFLAVTVARLVQHGRLASRRGFMIYFRKRVGSATGAASILLLLSHRAGLEAHRTLFAPLLGGLAFDRAAAIREAVHGRRPECSRGRAAGRPSPRCTAISALHWSAGALERLEQLPLDQLVDREVCAPLGLEVGSVRLLRARDRAFAARCMPTETVAFRGGEVHGVVHDEERLGIVRAWLVRSRGDCSGTALSIARFGAALLDAGRGRSAWLDSNSLAPLLEERRAVRCGPASTANRPTSPPRGPWLAGAVSDTSGSPAPAFGATRMPTGYWFY